MKKTDYSKTIARYYDEIYDDFRSSIDLKFYLDEISNAGGPVLEIGAGTGRILVEALRSGADIYGIDVSENMLDVLKGKLSGEEHSRISKMDARDLNLDMKFNLIIIPFRVLSHIESVEDQLKLFKNVYEHLKDGGRFIFDVYLPRPEYLISGRAAEVDFKKELPGGVLIRETIIRPDYVNQINNIVFKYTLEGKERLTDERELPMRYFFRFELVHLLERSGFTAYKFFGDFEKNPLKNGKWEMVVEAVKKS